MKIKIFVLLALGVSAFFPLNCPPIDIRCFPSDNPWNWDVSGMAVHPLSNDYVASIGATKNLHPDFGKDGGIPYTLSTAKEAKVSFVVPSESDAGPYYIPSGAPIEGGGAGGDSHVLAVDPKGMKLYELFHTKEKNGGWEASSGAVFDLSSNKMRPDGWTSGDAAGLPIFTGLVRYDEVARGAINHAIRFTVTVSQKKYFYPGTHYASSNASPKTPPMGLRMRLKAGANAGGLGKQAGVIAAALKKYGMLNADNGGDWFISGAPDDKWNAQDINGLKRFKGTDFEAVLTVDDNNKPVRPVSGLVYDRGLNPSKSVLIGSAKVGSGALWEGKTARFYGIPTGKLSIKVVDSEDNDVRRINNKSGEVSWDLKNDKGQTVPPGKYKIKVKDSTGATTKFEVEVIEKPTKK